MDSSPGTSARGPSSRTSTRTPWTKVDAESLSRLAAQLLRPPPTLDLSLTMAEAMTAVERRIEDRRAASFRDLVADCDGRNQVVVRFLALLELYRDGRVELVQGATYGEDSCRWQG